MTIIVETGYAVADADTYISVADADAHHAKRGNGAWALLSEPLKEQALVRATDYMVQTYRTQWKGTRTNSTQALDWPRYNVEIDGTDRYYVVRHDEVPIEVRRANADLALLAISTDLNPTLTQNVIEKTVGPITVKYDSGSPQEKRFRAIDDALSVYLGNRRGATYRLTRT